MEKEISVPIVISEDGKSNIVDPDYEWWLDPEFDEIRKYVKDFQNYCVLEDVDGFADSWRTARVWVKKEIFGLSGWKIFYFVSAFLDVDVDMEDPSFWEKLLNFILVIVSVVLVIVSANPVWLKIVLVTTTVMSYLGVLSPEIALAVAILSFSYGVYSTNFSAMGAMEMFSWAIKNVNMVMDMVGMHEAIGLKDDIEEDARERNKYKTTAQMQDEAMQYIYTDAYSQYDDLYSLLYNFEPKYKN
jgi:hypothetical protein